MRQLLAFIPLLCSLAAVAQPTPNPPSDVAVAVDIADQAARQRGGRTQLAVLGTSHLRGAPPAITRQAFEPLLARLVAFKPTLVAVESLSGAQCDYLRAYVFAYEDTAKTYCPDTSAARAHLKLDNAAAEREIEQLLSGGQALSPVQRRRLVALFLAVGEPDSACVQWLHLAAAERVADEALPAELIAQVDKRLAQRSENTWIAIPLAVRLGLERIYPVDDHTGDRATGPLDDKVYEASIKRIWSNPHVETRHKLDAQAEGQAASDGGVLAWYRWLNSPQLARLAVSSDFGAAAGDANPDRAGRAYLAYWETRNLRMAANIREVVGRTRADRAVAIVGASHKPYYERYLGMVSDIEVFNVDALLK